MTDLAINNSISVFFPCYNEQDNIITVVDKAVGVLEKLGVDFAKSWLENYEPEGAV